MDSDPIDPIDRYELQDRYLELTRFILPAEARINNWLIQDDHCFMRIILDHVFGGCWYDHLDRRLTAYKQLNDEQLVKALRLANKILREGKQVVLKMNEQSLIWRGKIKCP